MVPFIYQHFIKWNLEFWPKPLLGVPIHNTVLTLNLLIANYFRLKYKRLNQPWKWMFDSNNTNAARRYCGMAFFGNSCRSDKRQQFNVCCNLHSFIDTCGESTPGQWGAESKDKVPIYCKASTGDERKGNFVFCCRHYCPCCQTLRYNKGKKDHRKFKTNTSPKLSNDRAQLQGGRDTQHLLVDSSVILSFCFTDDEAHF